MKNILKIVIVEDIELFRKGLVMVINKFSNMHVVAEADTGADFLNLLQDVKPDIVLMDIELPDMSGIKITQEALKKYPKLKIIALTMFGESDYIDKMMKAGARGFLLKNINKDELKKALLTVSLGKIYYSHELMSYFYKKSVSHKEKSELNLLLTKREIEILNLIAQGLTDSEIGKELILSTRTINAHRNNMLTKTESKNTVNLIIYAIKNNLIELK